MNPPIVQGTFKSLIQDCVKLRGVTGHEARSQLGRRLEEVADQGQVRRGRAVFLHPPTALSCTPNTHH